MNKYYELNNTQVMMFIDKIRKLRLETPYFKDEVINYFEAYILKRTDEIEQEKHKLLPFINNKYIVSSRVVNHLTNITGINIFDKEQIKEYSKEKTKAKTIKNNA